ncbi:MAG: hypothetical protein JJE04_21750 [Acidobacteriia bacterium]|nr:hypothetical protein [Terriglobia bacterium]
MLYDVLVRTTLTVDPSTAQQIRKRMLERKSSLKEVVNELLRAGLKATTDQPAAHFRFQVEPHPCLFKAGIDQDKFTQLLDELDAEEVARKLRR